MSKSRSLRCSACGPVPSAHVPHFQCPKCSAILELDAITPANTGAALRDRFDSRLVASRPPDARDVSGVWRFSELLFDAAAPVSQPEGNTPLLRSDAVASYAGIDALWMKHEGHNPTGSFKDRGMTVAVTHARSVGAHAVACASTGNTSASLAAYAARAGIPSLVIVPGGHVTPSKLAQTSAYGAKLLAVRGGFDDCLRLVRDASEQLGIYLANSINPYRLEGQKTIIFEALQQLAWQPPDWMVVPAGNLGNTSAFGRALREAQQFGLIDRVPRLLAVQAAGAAPFVQSYSSGFSERIRVDAETVATAIRIGDPASWDRAVDSIRFTNGFVAAVTDEEILAAKRVIDHAGIGCEPASAASIAGIRVLRAANTIKATDRVVAILTGHLLKGASAGGDARIIEIDARVSEVERVLGA